MHPKISVQIYKVAKADVWKFVHSNFLQQILQNFLSNDLLKAFFTIAANPIHVGPFSSHCFKQWGHRHINLGFKEWDKVCKGCWIGSTCQQWLSSQRKNIYQWFSTQPLQNLHQKIKAQEFWYEIWERRRFIFKA